MTPEEKNKIVEKCVAMLMEHFETVQIVCTTRMEDKSWAGYNHGDGNWYARVGSVQEWLKTAMSQMGNLPMGTIEMEFPDDLFPTAG